MSVIQINKDPSRRTLNQFGFIWMGFLTLFGFLAWFNFFGFLAWFNADAHTAATVLWVLAVVVPCIGWLAPAFMRLVFLGLTYAAWPIGFVVSHVILALVYYLVFTPIGLIMRLVGYDPMARGFDREAESYWVERPTVTVEAKRYFRQF